jgi:acetyl esterase/lipase
MLRAKGFMVAAMNFSLPSPRPFPAQIRNLTCGVRFLRAHAVTFGLDTKRIGALGISGGGHLAAMLGVDDGSAMFVSATSGYARQSSDVQAVVDLWGVNDLTQHNLASYDERLLPKIFGPQSRWASESPITYVRPDLPPFLLVHGDRDTDVPIRQSRAMYKALLAAGDPVKFTVVHNAEHGLQPSGGTMSPSKAAVQREIVAFFAAKLGRGNPDQATTN